MFYFFHQIFGVPERAHFLAIKADPFKNGEIQQKSNRPIVVQRLTPKNGVIIRGGTNFGSYQ